MYTNMHTHTYTRTRTYTYLYTHAHIHIHIHIHIHSVTHTCTYTQMHTHRIKKCTTRTRHFSNQGISTTTRYYTYFVYDQHAWLHICVRLSRSLSIGVNVCVGGVHTTTECWENEGWSQLGEHDFGLLPQLYLLTSGHGIHMFTYSTSCKFLPPFTTSPPSLCSASLFLLLLIHGLLDWYKLIITLSYAYLQSVGSRHIQQNWRRILPRCSSPKFPLYHVPESLSVALSFSMNHPCMVIHTKTNPSILTQILFIEHQSQ